MCEPHSGVATPDRRFSVLVLVASIAVLALSASRPITAAEITPKGQDLFGWVESVLVGKRQMALKAKLDTGAETSSLDASDIRYLRRRPSGQRFVEFRLSDEDSGRTVNFKKRLVREARIKQHDGSFQTRPVVIVSICLGDHLQNVEVTLIDRSEFLYPVLLGRRALAGLAVVDPDLTFTRDPNCSDREGSH
jgi:hypothetical protein